MNETYFVANTQETESGRAQSIFAYDNKNAALGAYHSTLASNYAAADAGTLKSFAVALLNLNLYSEKYESWSEPAPEPNEEA